MQTRISFRLASLYATTALKDPKIKEIYQSKAKPGQSAYNVAIRDFFHLPEISNVDVSGYNGKEGSVILMRVMDDVMVTAVLVSIYDGEGKVVEEGAAMVSDNGLDYVYTATKDNLGVKGGKVVIVATDLPDNKAETTVAL